MESNTQTSSAALERGKKLVIEMFGQQFQERLSTVSEGGSFGSPMAALALEFAFGSVWTRPGLERKQRSLVTLGILIGTCKVSELKNHVRAGIRNGLTAVELQEVIVQSVPYCGFPAAAEASEALVSVLREEGLLPASTVTSKERGLL